MMSDATRRAAKYGGSTTACQRGVYMKDRKVAAIENVVRPERQRKTGGKLKH